jgi:hypothetical protein
LEEYEMKRDSDSLEGLDSRMGIVGIHPAVFRKSAEELDGKRVMKHSWCKERKERGKRAAEGEIARLAGMGFGTSRLSVNVHGRG